MASSYGILEGGNVKIWSTFRRWRLCHIFYLKIILLLVSILHSFFLRNLLSRCMPLPNLKNTFRLSRPSRRQQEFLRKVLYEKCSTKRKKHCPFVSERGDYKYEDKKPIKAQTACFPNDVINNLSFKNIWSLLVLTTKEWITSETLRIKWQKNRRRSPQHHHLLQQPQLWHPRS